MKSQDEEPRSTATIELAIGGEVFDVRVTVPKGPTSVEKLLPVFRSLTDSITEVAVSRVAAEGRTVSCKKGCGACCRQLVPIAEPEARAVAELVEAMPEPRRTEIRARFAAARARLEESGLHKRLLERRDLDKEARLALGLDYFRLGLPCPFLEDESCSIYEDRPIACREYLVTSPAENCKSPSAETIRIVPPLVRGWMAIARLDEKETDRLLPWVPLVLAPELAPTIATPPVRPGPELLETYFQKLIPPKKE